MEEFNEILAVQAFIEKNTKDINPSDRLVAITKAVAEIPWGEGRSVEDVFTKGVGTCTGKHKVLQACYDQMGIKYRPVVCTFRWSDQPVNYPDNLKAILAEGSWPHGHNFVQLEDGTDIDVTWNSALASYGFKTLPEEWDIKTSFVGVDNIIERWDGANIDEMKAQLIGDLDKETKERRERFLHGFIEWIDSINQSNRETKNEKPNQ